jgi:hypothetical protein
MYGFLQYAEYDMKKIFTLIDAFPFLQAPFEWFCFRDDTPYVIALIHPVRFRKYCSYKGRAGSYLYILYQCVFRKNSTYTETAEFRQDVCVKKHPTTDSHPSDGLSFSRFPEECGFTVFLIR